MCLSFCGVRQVAALIIRSANVGKASGARFVVLLVAISIHISVETKFYETSISVTTRLIN